MQKIVKLITTDTCTHCLNSVNIYDETKHKIGTWCKLTHKIICDVNPNTGISKDCTLENYKQGGRGTIGG